jgi:acyl-[acyl-carrier-protein]-phospholipid O-acyltransferase/long-chain-fatty-acid--[acyl-carrier-protein] ligase
MKPLYKLAGFVPYMLIVFLNATVDLGHKIILQNTIFKSYDGSELIIYTAIINALILLPFIFLFSPSGFLSDRYSKNKIIKVASFIAIIITSLITFSYYQGWFEVAFMLTLVLAAQSAIYSPAKYGMIKELFGVKYIASANGATQAITITSILLGALFFSVLFEGMLVQSSTDPDTILTYIAPLGFILILFSIFEFLLSLKLPTTREDNPAISFSLAKYFKLEYFRHNTLLAKRDTAIWSSIIGLSIFWALGQTMLAVIPEFLKSSLGVTDVVKAQGTLSLGGLGIVMGSLFAARMSKRYIETGLIPIGSLGVAIALFFIPQMTSLQSIAIAFFIYGFCAGLFIVPLSSLIQFSAPNFRLGKILAANNFYQNLTMLLALIITAYLSYIGFNSGHIITVASVVAGLGALYTLYRLPQSLVRYVFKFFFSFKHNIDVFGLDNIPNNKGVLLLGNHVSYLDWAVLQIAYPKQIRFVMEKSIYKRWYIKWFLDFFDVIPISKGGSKDALALIGKALDEGATVALFPEGYLSRNGQINNFLKGYEIAVKGIKNAMIVPFYLHGVWENKLSHASDKLKQDHAKISVSFGEALVIDTHANEIRDKVVALSVESWEQDIVEYPSIPRYWFEKIKQEKNFFIADSTGVNLNNSRFLAAVLMIRTWLKRLIGQNKCIGVILPSSVAGSMTNMALFTLSKVVVNLNYTTGLNPLQAAVDKADIQTVITSRKFIKKLASKGFELDDVLSTCNIVYLEDMKPFAHKARAMSYYLRALLFPVWLLKFLFTTKQNINDTVVILFSSGSEGNPKGIELSHKNLIGNIKQAKSMLNPTKDDVLIGTLPTFHSFGLTICTLLPQLEGLSVVYHPDPTDGYGVGKLVASYQGTILLGTATFLRLYARNKKCQPLMFRTIRQVIAGAERLPSDVRNAFKQKFGLDIYEGYGATETAPVASANVPDQLIPDYWKLQVGQKNGTIGKALLGTKIIITDPQSYEELPVGEEGMILITGVQVMNGYLKDSDKTDEVIVIINDRRWYVTGDKGKIDEDGFITIVDRYSRFAKIGGEMVSLGSVEAQIQDCIEPMVEICATSVKDTKKGEKIVLLYSGDIDSDELKKLLLKSKINPLYLPSNYLQIDTLPKLGTGKADFNGAKKMAKEILEKKL